MQRPWIEEIGMNKHGRDAAEGIVIPAIEPMSRSALAVCCLLLSITTGCGESSGSLDTLERWDLVFYSDSLGSSVAEQWAERIESTVGVEVVVHDFAISVLPATDIAEWIAPGGKHHELIREAEIIAFFGNPIGSGTVADSSTCISPSTAPREPPAEFRKDDWTGYRDVLRSIFDSVFEARAGKPTIIRSMDFLLSVVAEWKQAGIYDECLRELSLMNEIIAETAAEYDVPVASVFAAFNGPRHDEDPKDKGWIGPDRIHPSPEGQVAMVEVFHSLGYEAIIP